MTDTWHVDGPAEPPSGEDTRPTRAAEATWYHGKPLELRPPELPPEASPAAEWPERLLAEQRQRWHQGDRVPAEAFLDAHPLLQSAPGEALALVFGEYRLRRQLGESPTLEE